MGTAQKPLPELKPRPSPAPGTSVKASGASPADSQTSRLHVAPTRLKRPRLNLNGACEPCRRAKRKCNGEKPRCQACERRAVPASECVYSQLEGVSRIQTLKQSLRSVKEEREILRSLLAKILPSAPTSVLNEHLQDLGVEVLSRALGQQSLAALGSADTPHVDTPLSFTQRDLKRSESRSPDAERWSPRCHRQQLDDSPVEKSKSNALWRSPSCSDDVDSPLDMRKSPIKNTGIDLSSIDPNLSPGFGPTTFHDSQARRGTLLSAFHEELWRAHMSHSSDAYDWKPSEAEYRLRVSGFLAEPKSFYPTLSEQVYEIPFFINAQVPVYTLQPLHLNESVSPPFSRSILSFLKLARKRLSEGWRLESILGPIHYDISRLLNETSPYTTNYDDFSVPSFAISVMLTFSDASLMTKICVSLYCARIMRWLISPTNENYSLLGPLTRPTPMQLLVPHFAEYDILILPIERDALVAKPREYLQTAGYWHCTWDPDERFTVQDPRTSAVTLTSAFEIFAMEEGSWAVEPMVLDVFPELVGRVDVWRREGVGMHMADDS